MPVLKSRTVLAACMLALVPALVPGPAAAFSLFGITLFQDQNQQAADAVIASPQPYQIAFDVRGGDTELTTALKTASSLYQGRDKPASGAAGLLATARGDYARLVAALYAQGYYGGTVSILVDGKQATDLAPDVTLRKPATVSISVDPGPLFHFGTLQIVNRAPPSAADVGAGSGFAQGMVAKSGAVVAAARAEVNGWRAIGYPKAKVDQQKVVADHKTRLLAVRLVIAPGRKARLGQIDVKGGGAVDPGFIVRASGLKSGSVYSPVEISKARARLVALETFTVVRIVAADKIKPDGTLPLTIVVKDRKPRRIGAGATYSTTDGLGLEGFWLHRNLFGQAEKLRLDAKLAGIAFPIQSGQFDYYFGGTFTKPALFSPDTDLTAALIGQRSVLSRYTETSLKGSLGITHDVGDALKARGKVFGKAANFYDDGYGERNFTTMGLEAGLTLDTRDNPTDATRGIYADVSATPFYEAHYGNAALKLEAEGRTYLGFGGGRFVLAGRAKVGALLGPSIAETPPDQLFFSGGGGSVRGFAYRSIGVDGPGGSVTGGKFLAETSLEARVKVTDTIGAVGFVDAGYVTADGFSNIATGGHVGLGAGLRYYTGLGPLRLDFAVPINKRAGDPNYALYVGIGQAF